MSAQPNVSTSWMRRKVMGVPLIYLAGGFVIILAALAWRMKPSSSAAPADTGTPVESAGDTILSGDTGTLPPVPLGTVVAPPPAPANDNANTSIDTNDEWLKRGVSFLIQQGYGPGDAQRALSTYLDSGDVSMQQAEMRDKVIREFGLPPNPPTVGNTIAAPGRIQGTLPRVHVVKVPAEDSAGELAALYYGPGKSWKPIADANNGRVSFKIGESVKIPVYPTNAPARKQGTPPLTHIVKSPLEDSAGELAALYYGPGRSYYPIEKANGNRVKYTIGQHVQIPVYPKPAAK